MRLFLPCFLLIAIATSFKLKAQDLPFYIEQAKANSALINDQRNQIEAANLETERLKALYTKAQVSLSGSYLLAPIFVRDNGKSKLDLNPSDKPEDYIGYDLASSNGGIFQGLVNVNQPLFNSSRYKITAEQNLIGTQINQNTIQLTTHELEKVITDQYILCLQDYKQTEYLDKVINLINEQLILASKLVQSGITTQADFSLLMIEQNAQKKALQVSRTAYRKDLMDLYVLCGIPDTTYQVLNDIDLKIEPDFVASRFTEQYSLDSLNLITTQKSFELKYKPQVEAFANAGLNAVYAPTIPNRFGFSTGINFVITISDGHQRKLAQKRTDVLLQSLQGHKTFFYNQNTVRKNRILTEMNSIDEQLAFTNEQLGEYQKLISLYKEELRSGQLSVIDYISFLKNMMANQRDFVLLQTNKQLLINLYNYWNW